MLELVTKLPAWFTPLGELWMLVGTATSSPEEMTAFLLLLVKTCGVAATLNRLVVINAETRTSRELAAVKKPLNPPAPPVAICVILLWLSRLPMFNPVGLVNCPGRITKSPACVPPTLPVPLRKGGDNGLRSGT